jgi:hypothetical protein
VHQIPPYMRHLLSPPDGDIKHPVEAYGARMPNVPSEEPGE